MKLRRSLMRTCAAFGCDEEENVRVGRTKKGRRTCVCMVHLYTYHNDIMINKILLLYIGTYRLPIYTAT